MARSNWIAPRPDAACGKVFLASHCTARRNIASPCSYGFSRHIRGKSEYRLVPYRCNRCGGFHIAQKKDRTAIAHGCDSSARHYARAVGHSGGYRFRTAIRSVYFNKLMLYSSRGPF